MHYNCFIVDDEVDLAKMTCEYFEAFGVTCTWAEDAAGCLGFFEEHTADILLLDINLCEESGFDLCKRIRESSDIPILFISARQSDDDVLIALNIGGDDYIKKPYTLSVLLAKVKALLKRIESNKELLEAGRRAAAAQAPEGNDARISSRGRASEGSEPRALTLDKETMSAVAAGRRIPLKAREFALLSCLYEHRNAIVTKEQLFDTVWGDTFYSDGTLNVHIRRLREKLEVDPNEPRLIKTIWGTGYMLETEDEN